MGNPESVKMNVLKLNGNVYYYYPLSLGLPNLDYFGMIKDTVNQRILIPIRSTVHTHVHGAAYPIDDFNARSEEDFITARLLESITFVKNHVIEPSGSTYKTGQFDGDSNNNNYTDLHVGLTLEEICLHVNN
jgi:hypothetical protein